MNTRGHEAIAQTPSLLTPRPDTVTETPMTALAAYLSPAEPCEAR